jgi:hypothetical protein
MKFCSPNMRGRNGMVKSAIVAVVYCSLLVADVRADGRVVVFNETAIDKGDVAQGKIVEGEFHLQNIGASPIRIVDFRTACSCSTGELPSTMIESGKTGSLLLKLDTKGKCGATNAAAVVLYEIEGRVYQQRLNMRVNVLVNGKIVAIPPTLDLGTRLPGELVQKHFVLKRLGKTDLETRIMGVECPAWVRVCTITKDANEFTWSADATIQVQEETGMGLGKLRVRCNDPNYPITEIPVIALVEEAITANPSRVVGSLDPRNPGEPISIVVRDKHARDITIVAATWGDGGDLLCAQILPDQKEVHIVLRDPASPPSVARGRLEIQVRVEKDVKTLSVPVLLLTKKSAKGALISEKHELSQMRLNIVGWTEQSTRVL